jgi:hypothetical protein
VGPCGELYLVTLGTDIWSIEEDGSFRVRATGFMQSVDCVVRADGKLLQLDHETGKVWSVSHAGMRAGLEVVVIAWWAGASAKGAFSSALA